MALKIYKEVHVDDVKFVYDSERLVIQFGNDSSNAHHISSDDARELAKWLSYETGLAPLAIHVDKGEYGDHVKEVTKKPVKKEEKCDYIPSPRSATQTVPLKIGDPNLAYQNMRGRAPGDGDAGVVDLGKMVGSVQVS